MIDISSFHERGESQRWSIPGSAPPPGLAVVSREPGLWLSHRTALLSILAVVVVQTALIARLFVVRRRNRETTANLNLAAEAAGIGLWHRAEKADTIQATPRWRRIFGLPATGPIPVNLALERIHPDDRERMEEAIRESARSGGSFALDHRVLLPDGTLLWVASHGRSYSESNGRYHGTRGASMDITEVREASATTALQRQELAHLSRVSTLGVLSGALAHELNQPLGIILSNAQAAEFLLESENPDLDELRAIIADIVSEDRRAGAVIKRLRALLRRGETTAQPVDVNESIRGILELTRSDLISRNITASLRLADALPPALTDRVQFQQVILNLIVNACDAMTENKPVDRALVVETRAGEEGIRISVKDRGVGLPEDVERLFEPFHSTKEHGLGMGLAICRTLIEAQGGRLWAESNPDRGATFHVLLPISTTTP